MLTASVKNMIGAVRGTWAVKGQSTVRSFQLMVNDSVQ